MVKAFYLLSGLIAFSTPIFASSHFNPLAHRRRHLELHQYAQRSTGGLYNRPDKCKGIAPGNWMPAKTALDCYKSFSYDPKLATEILDDIEKLFNFYTSESISLNTGSKALPLKVDLRKGFQNIRAKTYQTDYDFNMDLFNLIFSLQDGHTLWVNQCYLQFAHAVALPVVSVGGANGTQELQVASQISTLLSPSIIDYTFQQSGINTTMYQGAVIKEINDKDAYVYIRDEGSKTGQYLGLGNRVNSMYAAVSYANKTFAPNPGNFVVRYFSRETSIKILLRRPGNNTDETITLPFVSIYDGKNFTNSQDYYAKNCQNPNYNKTITLSSSQSIQEKFLAVAEMVPLINPTLLKQLTGVNPTTPQQKASANAAMISSPMRYGKPRDAKPIFLGTYQGFFLLNDGKTGLVSIGTYSSKESLDSPFEIWESEFDKGMQALKKAGAENLIIDHTGNGGGYVCLGLFTLQYLYPGCNDGYHGYPTAFRSNNFTENIVHYVNDNNLNSSTYFAQNWAHYQTGMPFKDINDDFYFPTITRNINGQQSIESQFLSDICPKPNITMPKTSPFNPKRIVLTGNGNCASTCALVTTYIAENRNATAVGFGGLPMQYFPTEKQRQCYYKQEISGMKGGQVIEYDEMVAEFQYDGPNISNNTFAFNSLPVNAIARVNYRSAYSPKFHNDTPINFAYIPVDIEIPFTPTSSISIIEQAYTVLDQVISQWN